MIFIYCSKNLAKGQITMRRLGALIGLAIVLCACASQGEIPPADALIKNATAAIEIGKKTCVTYWHAEQVTNWQARYSQGAWRVMGGRWLEPRTFPDCSEYVVSVDAKTGKPEECAECVVVSSDS